MEFQNSSNVVQQIGIKGVPSFRGITLSGLIDKPSVYVLAMLILLTLANFVGDLVFSDMKAINGITPKNMQRYHFNTSSRRGYILDKKFVCLIYNIENAGCMTLLETKHRT